MELIKGFDSNYRYILVAARRARQLHGGANPMVVTETKKPCRIAQQEVDAEKVKWMIPPMPKSAVQIAADLLNTTVVAEVKED
jgi:DNA-directed RNA polymerase subunit omega